MSDEEEPSLPAGLDLLWGRRSRGRQGPKPGLTVDAIVDAAIGVADAEGLAAVSMSRVAQELGYTTMSLYRYVDSKDELLALMWNASAAGAPQIEGASWRERLRSWSELQWDLLMVRSWVLEMPAVSPPAGPNALAWVEQALESLSDTALSEDEALGVVGVLSSYALGEARMSHDARKAAADGQPVADYAALLRMVVDEQAYPALYRVAWSGRLDQPSDGDPDKQGFLFGVERILDGVQALIDARTAP